MIQELVERKRLQNAGMQVQPGMELVSHQIPGRTSAKQRYWAAARKISDWLLLARGNPGRAAL